MKAISIPSAMKSTRRASTENVIPNLLVHCTMLKGIARNVTAVAGGLIRNGIKLAIQRQLLTEGLDHEELCPWFRYRYRSARLVCIDQLDGEGIPDSCWVKEAQYKSISDGHWWNNWMHTRAWDARKVCIIYLIVACRPELLSMEQGEWRASCNIETLTKHHTTKRWNDYCQSEWIEESKVLPESPKFLETTFPL